MNEFDVLIRGGTIYDGTGSPPFSGTIAIASGVIQAVSADTSTAKCILDATGCLVTPGFIDAHSNASWGLFTNRTCDLLIYQGITTAVTGNCGGSPFPTYGKAKEWIQNAAKDYGVDVKWRSLPEYASSVGPIGIDVMPLVGHGTLRAAAVGFVDKPLRGAGLQALQGAIQDAIQAGAWGVSFGLAYSPGMFADIEELVASCEIAAAAQCPCCFHIRIESDGVEAAVEEVISVAEKSHARIVICHHKALGSRNWGKTQRTMEMITRALHSGADIWLDMYPYTTVFRNLAALLPDWVHEGGRERLIERLGDEEQVPMLVSGLRDNVERWDARWEDTRILYAPMTPEFEGILASDLVQERGEKGILEILAQNNGRVLTLYEGADRQDLIRVARFPRTVVGSDGNAQAVAEPAHPRSYATFPKFLADYAFRSGVLAIEDAIARMTSMPAALFGFSDRGSIRNNMRADICVFTPDAILAAAPAESPLPYPVPRHLLVRGIPVIRDGKLTGELPGKVTTKTRYMNLHASAIGRAAHNNSSQDPA